MKRRNVKMMLTLAMCLALLAGCGTGKPDAKEAEGAGKDEAVSQEEKAAEENAEPAEGKEADGSGQENQPAEGVSEEAIEEAVLESVIFTVCSAEDSNAFSGKELTADPAYLQTAVSSEVYFCEMPLEKIEVHPIEEWAEDFFSYTVSDEVLGTVEPVEAEEAFRIYDLYPEGIPTNCLVFWLKDGSCGTFDLGYNGSGEEQVWECPLYKNYESMKQSREAEVKEGSEADSQ